ncbi:MAG: hypothetical protein J6P89_08800 [Oscillospiraceae bacterium]|nr:hypothetical protein [Oscillospiraceae bacterium]
MGFMGMLLAPFILGGFIAVAVFIITVIAILFFLSLILLIIGLILRKKLLTYSFYVRSFTF